MNKKLIKEIYPSLRSIGSRDFGHGKSKIKGLSCLNYFNYLF
jgi:hypothetical protein